MARQELAGRAPYVPADAERRLILWYIGIGFAHLAVGILMGIMQALEHMGIDLYGYIPFVRHYYQGLSIHGVFNVLIFTTFFIGGFLTFVTMHGLRRPMASSRLNWATFWLMTLGLLLVDWALLTNRASVLYTSYAPLRAHPAYYLGLALVVVGTWLLLANMLLTYKAWRREHPGERTPLIAFGSLVTTIMWGLASIGIAVEFVVLLLPWSLGLTEGVDPLLARSLFWFTGHPIVYFWLLPVYISWYFMLPKQAGGKLFSEPLARLAFLLFIPLSLPVGFHHQFTDPGVPTEHKAIHAFFTFAVFMPSMITAFTVLASLETGGRARGGRGWFGWIRRLPWGDPSVTGQLLAMVIFALGGISGLINASFNLNLVVHNTLFIPGHFHLTVGTASALSFMAISYWLVPYLSGRKLWSRRIGVWQAWMWFFGMLVMSRGMSWAGILGAPRRTMLGSAPYALPEWEMPLFLSAMGGAVLTISGFLFFLNFAMTLWRGEKGAEVEVPVAEPLEEERVLPAFLDRFAPWVTVAVVLLVIAYGPSLYEQVITSSPDVPGLAPY